MKKTFALITTAFLIAACANTTTGPRPTAHYAYKQYPPIMVNVASVQVVDYMPSMRAPNVEHLMPQPLPAAVSDWANTRFKANGATGTLVITVRDASMVGRDLNRTSGFKGAFTIDQAERYDAHITVDFNVDGGAAGTSGNGAVKVDRGSTIAEDASLQDRDRSWTTMEENMIIDLDAATMTMLQQRLPFLTQR